MAETGHPFRGSLHDPTALFPEAAGLLARLQWDWLKAAGVVPRAGGSRGRAPWHLRASEFRRQVTKERAITHSTRKGKQWARYLPIMFALSLIYSLSAIEKKRGLCSMVEIFVPLHKHDFFRLKKIGDKEMVQGGKCLPCM